MNIGFAIYGSLEQVSGGFIYDRALIDALTALGHTVEVVSLPWRGYARAIGSNLIPGRRPSALRPGGGGPPDVLIEDELIHPSLFLRGWRRTWPIAANPPGRTGAAPPRVALVHNLRSRRGREEGWSSRPQAWIERRYLESVDGMIAVCRDTLVEARALRGHARDRRSDQKRAMANANANASRTVDGRVPADEFPTLIAYAGRDHVTPEVTDALVERRSHEPGPLRILHVAALVPHKGLLRLLSALTRDASHARATGAASGFRLDVVGSTERDRAYVRRVRAFIAENDLADRVHLHGERRASELMALYRRAQVMALPSDREAYSLACLEALGFGLPVIATRHGGLAEMLSDPPFERPSADRCGELIEPTDVAGLRQALDLLASDRASVARRGQAALARYREHRAWHEVALSVQAFLAEVIARRPAANRG